MADGDPRESKADGGGLPTGPLSEASAFLRRLLGGAAPPADPPRPSATRAGDISRPPAAPSSTPSPAPTSASGIFAGLSELMKPSQMPGLQGIFDNLQKFTGQVASHGMDLRQPAAPPLPEGARFELRSFGNEAGSRDYWLYVPSRYRGEPVPLLVMLHGCTQTSEDFAGGTQMNALAEEHVILVAYPGQSSSANPGRCWNWFDPNHQQRDRGEPSLIAGITREIVSDFAVRPDRVFVAGLSAGGAMASIMGSAYPELYAGVAVHSGLAHTSAADIGSAMSAMAQGAPAPPAQTAAMGLPSAERAVPTIVIHGDRDSTVHAMNGERLIADWIAKNRGDYRQTTERLADAGGRPYTRTCYGDGDGRVLLEYWILHGFGHAWSGGNPGGSFTDPNGPNASREILRFFLSETPPNRRSANYRDRLRDKLGELRPSRP